MPRKDDWSDLSDWGMQEIEKEYKQARKKIVNDFMSVVTEPTGKNSRGSGITPVDSGTLMANTFLTVDSPSGRELNATDKGGSNTYTRAMNKLSQAPLYSDIYIQNNLDYAELADTKGWYDGVVAGYRFWQNSIQYTVSEMSK